MELDSTYYDHLFEKGGSDGTYHLPYRHSHYFPLYRAIKKELRAVSCPQILEIGCGNGALAHYLFDSGLRDYLGFDFSPVAVEQARSRTGRLDSFFVGNALDKKSYYANYPYNIAICTEVLEHIEADLRAISYWKSGSFCICSVPNFDSVSHVRFFQKETDIYKRYDHLIRIESIRRIKSPQLSNISFTNRVRHLIWNRYRPRRFLELLGISRFSKVGGWFLFSGFKK